MDETDGTAKRAVPSLSRVYEGSLNLLRYFFGGVPGIEIQGSRRKRI